MSESRLLEELDSNQTKIQEMLNKEERRIGQLEQLKKNLYVEFGVKDLAEAETRLKEITDSIDMDEAELEKLNTEMVTIITKAKGDSNVVV